jgi:cardiolipin synthase A/B
MSQSSILSPASILFSLYAAFVVILTVRILLDNKAPEVSIAWLLAIYFLPYLGAGMYILGGINWKKRKIMKMLPEKNFETLLGPILTQQMEFLRVDWENIDNDIAKNISLALTAGNAIITLNNSTKTYYEGGSYFENLITDLESAVDSIHLEVYIYRSDELGCRIRDILVRKAEEGVKVRLLFDGVGCFNKMSRRFKRELKSSAVEVRYFLDPMNVLSGRLLNYRNHRKVTVIDGKTGYTGGMNIGLEYLDGGRQFKCWRDTHIRMEGDAVQLLQAVFLSDWFNSGGGMVQDQRFFPDTGKRRSRQLPTQIVCSGPDSDWNSIRMMYANLIHNANQRIFVQSPYFVPEATVMNALTTASLSGVEVNLMMTGVPDKRIPFWVAHTYFEELIAAGVNIYLYEAGFFHAKTLVIDDSIATVGSCNLDVRSFHLDYELNAFFYDQHTAKELIEKFEEDRSSCRKIQREDIRRLAVPLRLRNSLFRMIAPLL